MDMRWNHSKRQKQIYKNLQKERWNVIGKSHATKQGNISK